MTDKTWFIAGTVAFMVAGGGHALLTLFDAVRPTFFTPIDDSVRVSMQGTGFRFRRLFPNANDVTPSMWHIWLGMNVSHGLGVFLFGLLCLLVALHDFTLVQSIGAIQPLTIAVAATYFLLSLRFWFYAPTFVTAFATTCFTVSALSS